MRALIFGGTGRIGSAVAWDLARHGGADAIGIIGRNQKSLKDTAAWINSEKVKTHVLDIADTDSSRRLMQRYDLAVIALPDRRGSYRILETAIETGLDAVDVLEEYHRRPDPYEIEGLQLPANMSLDEYGDALHRKALQNEVSILDGMGFAPGLSNIALGEGIRRVEADQAVARVGGIPTQASALRHPLKYMITWSFAHVLREYMVKVRVIQDGEIKEVDATSERERFRFNECGQYEELECAITPGMPSFLYTQKNLKSFAEKTIRWPGHWQAIETLKECGLMELKSVKFKDESIRPRDFLLSLLEPRLRPLPGDRDLCVMWNTALGNDERADHYMWAGADAANGISAMARVTGFCAAIGARMLAGGVILERGILAPEEAIYATAYQKFMEELARRGIIVAETIRRLES